jgi:hypothetical protein
MIPMTTALVTLPRAIMQRMRIVPQATAVTNMFRIPNRSTTNPGKRRPMKLAAFMITSCTSIILVKKKTGEKI